MGQPRPQAGIQARPSSPVSIVVRTVRRGQVALWLPTKRRGQRMIAATTCPLHGLPAYYGLG
jgi:hypothetical protein